MDERPRRRRRRRPQQEPRSLPLPLILVAIVVAGFAIGGAFSLYAHRDTRIASAPPSAEPSSIVTLAPAPLETLAPPAPSPTPEASPTVTASPRPAPSPSPSPAPASSPTASPRATVNETATPAASPSDTPSPAATHGVPPTAKPVAIATAKPVVVATAKPTALATPKTLAAVVPKPVATPVPAQATQSDFARQSESVVRSYLSALARGDDAGAAAVLDAPAGSRAAQLSEKEFAGPEMRISDIEAHGSGDDVRVDVDLQTAKGAYFAQFFVKKSPSGTAVIVNHDFIKP